MFEALTVPHLIWDSKSGIWNSAFRVLPSHRSEICILQSIHARDLTQGVGHPLSYPCRKLFTTLVNKLGECCEQKSLFTTLGGSMLMTTHHWWIGKENSMSEK